MNLLKRVMIFIDESARFHNASLSSAIVDRVRKEGCKGATVLHGTAGFGSHGQVYTTAILDISSNLPVIVLIVDDAEKIDRILPILSDMVSEGLITVDEVQGIRRSSQLSENGQSLADSPRAKVLQPVTEYMNGSFVTVDDSATVGSVIKMLVETKAQTLPVTTKAGKYVGSIEAYDLLAPLMDAPHQLLPFFGKHKGGGKRLTMAQLSALPIDTFVRKDSIAVEPDFPLQKAIQLMIRYSLSALPVVQQQALIGILSLPDLFGRISD